jgi:hypothetical protein
LGIEVFERAAEARARILRVQQLVSPGRSADPSRAAGYLLTFDVGRILVVPAPSSEGLVVSQVEDSSEIEAELFLLDEEDPWWRVIGNSITGVWPGVAGQGASAGKGGASDLRLQFREDTDNPKVITLSYAAGAVQVKTEASVA